MKKKPFEISLVCPETFRLRKKTMFKNLQFKKPAGIYRADLYFQNMAPLGEIP